MKAIVHDKFGPPEVLYTADVENPSPGDHEVLIRIYAATVATEDPTFRKSGGLNGFWKPRNPILGFYLAGEIEEAGAGVTLFKPGDRVYGSPGVKMGSYAEYKCMPETGALVKIPSKLSYEEAAAIPNGGLTALPFLRDKGKIRKGQKVLIYGASGAVGTSAIQIAKYFETEVTGVCSTANLELVKSLGADHVIDYTREDFTEKGKTYDIVFDTVAKLSLGRCKKSMNDGGIYLTTGPDLVAFLHMLLPDTTTGKRARFSATGLRKAHKKVIDLQFMNEMIEEGSLRAVIDRTYPMDQISEAHRYVESGRKKGNVVITI